MLPAGPEAARRPRTGLDRLRRWLAPPRRLRPTLDGLVFLALVLAIAGAALNTGNNLLYLVCAMTLALVAISGVLSESALQRVRLQRRLPAALFAGEPARGSIRLSNPRRWLPNVALRIDERPAPRCDGGATPATVAVVPAGADVDAPLSYTFHRRGLHRLAGFRIGTTYPFGLFRKSYDVAEDDDVLVFPRPGEALPAARRPVPGPGDHSHTRRGLDGDYLGLRDFVDGEDARHIHWRTSARRDALVAIDRSDAARPSTTVALLPADPPPAGDDAARRAYAARFEDAVSTATATALQLLDRGHRVGLRTAAGHLPPAAGTSHRRALLTHLALLPTPDAPLPPGLRELRRALGDRDVTMG